VNPVSAEATPESAGLPSRAVLQFLNGCEEAGLELHALELLRHGRTLVRAAWRPFRLDAPHALYSVSKSFVSTAVGFAVAEGLFGLDDPLPTLFPADLPDMPDGSWRPCGCVICSP